jgi:iron complex outermembrane recepter protein
MKTISIVTLLAGTVLTPGLAIAQTGPDVASESSEAIVVTARKRDESLQDVPIAITALGSDTLQSARVETLQDVAKLTPGLNYTPLFGKQNQLPIIRGVAQTLGQLNVGVFLDGVYLSGKAGVDLELNDLARVEVIKGPQSALYGRNTFAGAINYVTARPTKDLSGRAEFTIGDNGLYKSVANISGPLSDTLRIRVGGYAQRADGFYTSAIDGGRVDFSKSYGGSGTLEWQPVEPLTITLRGTYYQDDDGQPASSVIRNNAGFGVPPGATFTGFPAASLPLVRRNLIYTGTLPTIPLNGVFVSTRGINIQPGAAVTSTVNGVATPGVTSRFPAITFFGDKEEATRVSLTMAYDFGNIIGTSISAYSSRHFNYTYDGDNTICDRTGGCQNFGFPFAPADAVGKNNYALSSSVGSLKDFSQELRFQSNEEDRVNWLFGLFYYHNTNDSIDRSITPTVAAANAFFFPRQVIKTDSYAVFASANVKLADALTLSGELRYEYEKQSFTQNPTNPSGSGTLTPNVTGVFDLRQDFRFITPRVILDYKLGGGNLIYVSYARGAKTGGFNTGANVFANQRAYQPEYADNFEAGVKTTFMGGKARTNLAGFVIDWQDQQVVDQNPVTAGGSSTNRSFTANTAASRIYGLEFDTALEFAPWFTLAGNYAYTKSRYKKFTDVTLNGTTTPLVPGLLSLAGLPNVNFAGNHLPYVPDHKFVLSPILKYPFAGDDGSIEARADVSYQSKTYLRADNFATFPARTNLDLRLTGTYRQYRLQLFMNNVTDERSPVAGVRFFDASNYSVSSPYVTGYPGRQIGASVGVKF